MQDSERAQKANEIADRIVAALFVNGCGEQGERLVMRSHDGRDQGGWSRRGAKLQILKALAGGSDV
jgi:hypothetical protein